MTRLYQILRSINELLGEFKPVARVVEHYIDEGAGVKYTNARVFLRGLNALLVLREYWQGETLAIYGYYIRIGGQEEWWDNRPHHSEIDTFPHHRHVGEKVSSLQNPALEEFLRRARELLSSKKQNRKEGCGGPAGI